MSSNTLVARDVSRDRAYTGNCQVCGPARTSATPTAMHIIEVTPEGQYAGGVFLCQKHWQQALKFIARPSSWHAWADLPIH